jgi:hypothetical protein
MGEVLLSMDDQSDIAKTCPVLQITAREEMIEELEQAEAPMGEYIEDLIQAKEEQGAKIPWLKDYLLVIREGKTVGLYGIVPSLEGWYLSLWQ